MKKKGQVVKTALTEPDKVVVYGKIRGKVVNGSYCVSERLFGLWILQGVVT